MDDPNPYASPIAEAEVIFSPSTERVGVWRRGNKLVMHKLARLPDVCLKTGNPAERRVRKKLQWHHPALYLLVFGWIILYLFVALIVTRQIVIDIPVTHDWMRIRRRRMAIPVAIALTGAAVFGVGIFGMANDRLEYSPFFLIGPLILIVGLVATGIASRIVWPAKINDTHVYLSGVHQDVLATLDVWPYD